MEKSSEEYSPIVCKMCALYLMDKCYKKHWWFHLVRDPLVWGMKYLAWCNGIDARKHGVRKTRCKGCIRFMKEELMQKSPTFNFLNKYIGPRFQNIRNPMLNEEDVTEGKKLAKEAMED